MPIYSSSTESRSANEQIADTGVCHTRQTTGVKYSFNWGTNLVLNLKEPSDPKLLGGSDELYELKLGVSYLHLMTAGP